jgi:hypothetical protein
MNDDKKYSEQQAHRFFAASFHGKTWDLLEKADRSKEDEELMIYTAHASCRHWLEVGTGLNHQRGEWLIARVYSVLGLADAALRHAYRCLELTRAYADLMKDFDRAFAYEALARANAVAGNDSEANKYVQLAEEAGQTIKDKKDKDIFFSEFNSGNWNKVKTAISEHYSPPEKFSPQDDA